ncbi:MAG: heparan-alpha-glucosaminide N-acetyltransferase domain-containing protein [Legionellaceae bacterium]|nr:heparan-alpha-glucosaminide N-acetyltransferase domain-containing protein [Legionellaceae bacterium]
MNTTPRRFLSIDIFRGLTVAMMILVNSIDDQQAYSWLRHSNWNGCTLADLVFPFFIFIVGMSGVLSITGLKNKGLTTRDILSKIIKRTAILFLIGLLINAFPNHFDLTSIRFLGVLQRIAICYFFASLLFLTCRVQTQIFIITSLLVAYWLIMILIPVPGYGVHNLTQEGNLAAYFDRLIIPAQHLYAKNFDPEGIFSTLPAIATALLGNLLSIWLLTPKPHTQRLYGMLLAGSVSMVLGWLWGFSFPINKTIWSSSYVLWTSGIALLVYALDYWCVEIRLWHRWLKPFEMFGKHALIAFVLHVLFLKLQAKLFVHTPEGGLINLRDFLTSHLFPHVALPHAALLYACASVAFWLMVIFAYDRAI